MAMIKARIYDRGVTLDKVVNRDYKGDRELLDLSMGAYMLADGDTVKVYHDTASGGMVVEYNDGK